MKLIHGDCLEVLKTIPDQSIDFILTDLPYGTTECAWDEIIPFSPLWKELKRIIKPNRIIALFGSEPFSSQLRTSNINQFRYDWIWEKQSGANFLNAKYQPLKVHEIISIFCDSPSVFVKNKSSSFYIPQMESGTPYSQKSGKQKKDAIFNAKTAVSVITNNSGTRNPRSIIKFNKDNKKIHPTQKPVELLEYLIKTYSNENETVLDFTMGSGSTGVACLNTNRKFIGIEKDEKYFNIAKERLNDIIKS
jgi:site-specific DNA-methyltransferase (adenine-specific)